MDQGGVLKWNFTKFIQYVRLIGNTQIGANLALSYYRDTLS